MSVSLWSYREGICDGGGCVGDCDLCNLPYIMEDEEDETMKLDKWLHVYSNKKGTAICTEWVENVRENVKGEWIDVVVGTSTGCTYHEKQCSICGYGELLQHNFCSNCGADMRH